MKILDKELQQEGKEYVYLAEFESGYCKIGVSINPRVRLKNVSNKNQISLKDYVLVEGYYELEKILHKHFKEKRRYSEWFEINFYDLIKFVENLDYKHIYKEKKYKKEYNGKCEDVYRIELEKETLTGKEFVEVLKFENNFEKEITEELIKLENEFKVFIDNEILFEEDKLLKLIKLEKEYIVFLNNQRIKLGDELESIKEIELIIDFCYKYLIENY